MPEPDPLRLENECAALLLKGYAELACRESANASSETADALLGLQPLKDEGGEQSKKAATKPTTKRITAAYPIDAPTPVARSPRSIASRLIHLDPTKLMAWRLAALAELESTKQHAEEGESGSCGPAVSTYFSCKAGLAR
jgi:hypothetical protein